MNQTIHRVSPISMSISELTTLLSSGVSVFEIFAGLLVVHLIYQRIRTRVKVYLLDFTCYRAPDSNRVPMSTLIETIYLDDKLDQESIDFQARILERSWLSNQTSIPRSLMEIPLKKSLSSVKIETMTTIFTSVEDLLSGMGCAAGILSVNLANDLLQAHRGSLALIVSTEALNTHWYIGKDRSMLLTNCLFRMGAAAVLMSMYLSRHRL